MSVADPMTPAAGMTATSVARALRDLAMLTQATVAGKELRDQIVEHARRFFGADAVAMWRLESRERMWRIAATTGLSSDYSTFEIEAPTDGNVAAMLPGPLLIADVRAWPAVDARRSLYDTEGIVSFLVLPLIIRG
ncbi:MAG TPA: GAF domain-containing protein, partial [Thermoanaerobaculia bacterium]